MDITHALAVSTVLGIAAWAPEVWRELRTMRRYHTRRDGAPTRALRRQARIQYRAERAVRHETQAHGLALWLGRGASLVFHPDHVVTPAERYRAMINSPGVHDGTQGP